MAAVVGPSDGAAGRDLSLWAGAVAKLAGNGFR
jgi:hypothetical protein